MDVVPQKDVAGVDLGPSLRNESTGLLIAHRKANARSWIIEIHRQHRLHLERDRKNQHRCNTILAEQCRGCSVIVVDAPLFLESLKEWEQALIGCPGLTDAMKPSPTSAILSHAWRAKDLIRDCEAINPALETYEIFPAAWFWLGDFDRDVEWKGDAAARPNKIVWFDTTVKRLRAQGIEIDMHKSNLSADEADALPCVACAILAAESRTMLRLDGTQPPVLFPPKDLWDAGLPQSVKNLAWCDWSHARHDKADKQRAVVAN